MLDPAPELAEMRQAIRKVVEGEFARFADGLDVDGVFPPELVAAFARHGFLGVRIGEAFGGPGMSLTQYCLIQEEVSRVHPNLSLLVSSTSGLAPSALHRHGTPEQKQKYLPGFVSGTMRSAFALTEAEAGSDSAAIRTRAVAARGGFVINGIKNFISLADIADVVLVMAVTDPEKRGRGGITAFLVDRGTPGLAITRVDRTMGSGAWTLAEVTLTDCFVPADAVLGQVGGGFPIAMETLDEGRLSVASICLGAADRLLELATVHAQERRTFGGRLADRQAIQWMLADSATDITATRCMIQATLRAHESGQPVGTAASMCKLFSTEMANRVADRALQIHGASGVLRGSAVERAYRDLRLFRIGEGASEIQRMVIARGLVGRG